MDELRSYADRRLELGDMIRAALYLAREAGDEQAELRARDLMARLAADRFRLAVVGQFSPGKSRWRSRRRSSGRVSSSSTRPVSGQPSNNS
jgi:hypothetical protein